MTNEQHVHAASLVWLYDVSHRSVPQLQRCRALWSVLRATAAFLYANVPIRLSVSCPLCM